MTKDDFLRANHALLNETPYERRYVDEVLSRVPGLDWDALRAQTPFIDGVGVRRRIDFTIIESDIVKIAIEVDGYDKTGAGHGMTRAEFTAWSRREQGIAAAGYRLIRVANSLVDREPEECARTVELVLKRERALAELIRQLPVAQRTDATSVRTRYADELLGEDERNELKRLAAVHTEAMDALKAQLQDETDRRRAAEAARERVERDRRGMVTLARSFIVGTVGVAFTAAVVTFALTREDGDASAAKELGTCAKASPWTDAGQHRGAEATLRGPVADATFQSKTRGQPTFLDVGEPYPARDRLVIVVWGSHRSAFTDAPERLFLGKSIAVTGEVKTFRGLAQIEVTHPSQIAVC